MDPLLAGVLDDDSITWTIFVSFRHVPRDLFISERIVGALNTDGRGFVGRRIVDRPAYGSLFVKEIDKNLATVDGEIVLWSPEAARSFYVRYEIYRATKRKIPICLVKYETEPYPDWWRGDRHAIELKGIDAKDPKNGLPWTDERQQTGRSDFKPFLAECAEFASQVAKGVAPRVPPFPKPRKQDFPTPPGSPTTELKQNST
jgi:hypothetical protein